MTDKSGLQITVSDTYLKSEMFLSENMYPSKSILPVYFPFDLKS